MIKKFGEFSEDDKESVKKLLEIYDQHQDIYINEQKTKSLSPDDYYVNYEDKNDSKNKNIKSLGGSFSLFNKKNKKNDESKTYKTYQYCTIAGAICFFLFVLKLFVLSKF